MAGEIGCTHDLRIQPSGISALNDGMIEVVQIAFVSVLQFVEEVEDVESERCRWPVDCRRKPACTKKLDVLGRGTFAATITDDKTMSTG